MTWDSKTTSESSIHCMHLHGFRTVDIKKTKYPRFVHDNTYDYTRVQLMLSSKLQQVFACIAV